MQAGSEWKSSRILSLKHTPEILRRGSGRGQGGVREGSRRGRGGVREVSGRVQAGSEWKSSRILALEDDPGIPQHVPRGGRVMLREGSGRDQVECKPDRSEIDGASRIGVEILEDFSSKR